MQVWPGLPSFGANDQASPLHCLKTPQPFTIAGEIARESRTAGKMPVKKNCNLDEAIALRLCKFIQSKRLSSKKTILNPPQS